MVTSLIVLPSFIITITSQTASASPSPENFTIVALPDTQNYSQYYPSIFENQTEWIVQNENEKNIVFVTHLGDIVNTWNNTNQWQNANTAMSILDGKVPYGILPGNHDMTGGPNPITGADAPYYESYFPASRYEGYSYWGGSYDSTSVTSSSPNMNNYQLFSAGGMDFITLSLQYDPPADVLSWASNVLDNYSDRRAIISTHSYISIATGNRNTIGQNIYSNLVVPHNNVFLVLCGHSFNGNDGEREKIDTLGNRTVYQLLSDYQGRPNGGDGWLRIMEFVPSENKIYVRTYSPYLNQYETDSDSQFELTYPMGAPARSVTVSISPSSQDNFPGGILNYTVMVSNTGDVSDNDNLMVRDNAGWTLTLDNYTLGPIPPGGNRTTILRVTIPENAAPETEDNITVIATSQADNTVRDNASCIAHAVMIPWMGTVTFKLENLYKVGLEKNLQINTGSKLVVKFYKYDNTFQAESVIHSFTPPENIKENENVPHPRAAERFSWGSVQITRLILTTDDTENVISTIASFTVHQTDLRNRIGTILRDWGGHPEQQSAFRAEIGDILRQWSSAPP